MNRRKMLVGCGAVLATTGCAEIGFPAQPRVADVRHLDDEMAIAGTQSFCHSRDDALRDLAWPLRMMRVPQAWDYSVKCNRPDRGRNILIGHVDTGVADHVELRPARPDEQGPILWDRGYDFIYDVPFGRDPLVNTWHFEQIGHGTATASVIVSRGDVVANWSSEPGTCGGTTGPGRITGVAPSAFLVPTRAFRLAATSSHQRVADAIDHLRKKEVHVITMALGWPNRSDVVDNAIAKAIRANILVLAAAGNFVDDVTYPAKSGMAIAVAGIGPTEEPWRYSAHGKAITISAPGEKVWRAYLTDTEKRSDMVSPRFGTSFAVSLTAGVAALWLAHNGQNALLEYVSQHGYRTLQDLFRHELTTTARPGKDWHLYNKQFGTGIVDAKALLKRDLWRS